MESIEFALLPSTTCNNNTSNKYIINSNRTIDDRRSLMNEEDIFINQQHQQQNTGLFDGTKNNNFARFVSPSSTLGDFQYNLTRLKTSNSDKCCLNMIEILGNVFYGGGCQFMEENHKLITSSSSYTASLKESSIDVDILQPLNKSCLTNEQQFNKLYRFNTNNLIPSATNSILNIKTQEIPRASPKVVIRLDDLNPTAAENASFEHSSSSEVQSLKMFVGQIPRSFNEIDIKPIVERYGKITELHVLRDKVTGTSQGCCFVTFENRRSAFEFQFDWHNLRFFPCMRHPVQVKPANEMSNRNRKLFVGNLGSEIKESHMRKLFARYGEIEDVVLFKDTLGSKGCGFVIFLNNNDARKAIEELDQAFVKPSSTNLPLVVKYADDQKTKEIKKRRKMIPRGTFFVKKQTGHYESSSPVCEDEENVDEKNNNFRGPVHNKFYYGGGRGMQQRRFQQRFANRERFQHGDEGGPAGGGNYKPRKRSRSTASNISNHKRKTLKKRRRRSCQESSRSKSCCCSSRSCSRRSKSRDLTRSASKSSCHSRRSSLKSEHSNTGSARSRQKGSSRSRSRSSPVYSKTTPRSIPSARGQRERDNTPDDESGKEMKVNENEKNMCSIKNDEGNKESSVSLSLHETDSNDPNFSGRGSKVSPEFRQRHSKDPIEEKMPSNQSGGLENKNVVSMMMNSSSNVSSDHDSPQLRRQINDALTEILSSAKTGSKSVNNLRDVDIRVKTALIKELLDSIINPSENTQTTMTLGDQQPNKKNVEKMQRDNNDDSAKEIKTFHNTFSSHSSPPEHFKRNSRTPPPIQRCEKVVDDNHCKEKLTPASNTSRLCSSRSSSSRCSPPKTPRQQNGNESSSAGTPHSTASSRKLDYDDNNVANDATPRSSTSSKSIEGKSPPLAAASATTPSPAKTPNSGVSHSKGIVIRTNRKVIELDEDITVTKRSNNNCNAEHRSNNKNHPQIYCDEIECGSARKNRRNILEQEDDSADTSYNRYLNNNMGGANSYSYPAASKHEGPEGANLFIYHLPAWIEDDDLYKMFARFGRIISATVYLDKVTGQSKCFGFVSYSTARSASAAILDMHGKRYGNKFLKVEHKRKLNNYNNNYRF